MFDYKQTILGCTVRDVSKVTNDIGQWNYYQINLADDNYIKIAISNIQLGCECWGIINSIGDEKTMTGGIITEVNISVSTSEEYLKSASIILATTNGPISIQIYNEHTDQGHDAHQYFIKTKDFDIMNGEL